MMDGSDWQKQALRLLSDPSPEETAQVMGRSPGSVRVLQQRALLAICQLLEG